MKNLPFLFLMLYSLSLHCQKNYNYPKPEKSDTVDLYFDTSVPDPYRWLEGIRSPATIGWLAQQAAITDQYEKKQRSLKNGIYDKLLLYSYADFKPLIKRGKFYFHFSYVDLESPPVLYYQKGINGVSSPVVDPEDYREAKGEVVSVQDFAVSADNRYLAFSLSASGADWSTIRVKDIAEKKALRDVIRNVKFSDLSWKNDGFFYIQCDPVDEKVRITAANTNPRLFYHKIGDNTDLDLLVYDLPNQVNDKWFSCFVTSDGKYLILNSYIQNETKGFEKAILYASLDSFPSIRLKPLIQVPSSSHNEYHVINNIGTSFLVVTDLNAPTKRILLYDPAKGKNQYKEVIPQFKNVLEHASYSDGKIIALYYLRGQFLACVFNMEGKAIKQIMFPQGNSVRGFDVSPGDKETFYFVNSFYFPSVAHRLDLQTLKTEVLSTTYIEFDQTRFETRYITYRSEDSTEIPMFLTYRKGLRLKNNNPVLLYGYGGFGRTLTPFFNPSTIIWIENGGVFAVPGIRGGGEKGSAWHREGARLKRFNGYNDFISAAKFLVDSNYTSTRKLAIEGGSNGGLLVGVAMTQHPELFQAVVAEMGLFDMLRYNKFSIGSNWASEYGVSSNADDFSNLIKYSPLHNLKSGVKYPATLVITADNDDRVPPLHSYKYIATLQEYGDQATPYLLEVIQQGGHSGSEIWKVKAETEALKCLFLFRSLKVEAASIF